MSGLINTEETLAINEENITGDKSIEELSMESKRPESFSNARLENESWDDYKIRRAQIKKYLKQVKFYKSVGTENREARRDAKFRPIEKIVNNRGVKSIKRIVENRISKLEEEIYDCSTFNYPKTVKINNSKIDELKKLL